MFTPTLEVPKVPTEAQTVKITELNEECNEVLVRLTALIDGPEKEAALVKLQEVAFWGTQAILKQ